ncbi:aftiphilin a isoform X1 [Solea solea]|uniref:aftiphilin a isoform X1 n=1 Tax=Solea solea TaxID=90069 RepID=UPI002729DFF7|nr:aftiphilin a isoform X1 [Solea solea]
MEPDVIRMYSSSPPPLEEGGEEEDEMFGDFGTYSGVPGSISFTEFDTLTTYNQTQALNATSPPELLTSSRGLMPVNGAHSRHNEHSRANGIIPVNHQSGSPSERTEMKKATANLPNFSASDSTGGELADCNGESAAVLTNGFDVQGSPSSQNSVHYHVEGRSAEDTSAVPVSSLAGEFADFASFSDIEGGCSQTTSKDMDTDTPPGAEWTAEQAPSLEDAVRDTNSTGPGSCCTDADSQRDVAVAQEHLEPLCTNDSVVLNGAEAPNWDEDDLSPDATADSEAGQSDEKGSGNETETETETSFGRPLSTDALEEYGDISTTGSAPSPPLQGEPSTPADHSQLAEDDEEEDFGDFGDAGSFGGQGFADEFGDFNSPKFLSRGGEGQDGGKFAEFPASDSFGNFSSAVEGTEEEDTGWSAFEEQHQVEEGESWAEFSTEQSAAPSAERRDEEEEEEWHESEAPAGNHETCRTDVHTVSLLIRLQKVFESSFPLNAAASVDGDVVSLKNLLEPREDAAPPGNEEGTSSSRDRCVPGVWTQLQDVNEALGLRYQWGGSYCNKTLLCCLGIDTRNILFTGQKKQPVIVPMYAASLGMLEPTKEPLKPVSAAEMIAAIAQTPPAAADQTSCSSDSAQQEALPPVQFDWSSSGLINPLDGSSLLNLDFFGPDDELSCCTSLPGVDPELYELTTSKLDSGTPSSRVADAFARLMLTMEKTSTSTRKPRKDENLSEEASKVIAALPDLSFMQAKVLMFPATLMPLDSRNTND